MPGFEDVLARCQPDTTLVILYASNTLLLRGLCVVPWAIGFLGDLERLVGMSIWAILYSPQSFLQWKDVNRCRMRDSAYEEEL